LLQGGALVQYVEGNITSADFRSPAIFFSLTNEFRIARETLENRSDAARIAAEAKAEKARSGTIETERSDEQEFSNECRSSQSNKRSSGCAGEEGQNHRGSSEQGLSVPTDTSGDRPVKIRKKQPIFASKPVLGLPTLWDPKGKKGQPWQTTYAHTWDTDCTTASILLLPGYREHDIRFSSSNTYYIRPVTEHFLRQGRDDIVHFIRERRPLFVFDFFQRHGKEEAIRRGQQQHWREYDRPEPLWHTRLLPTVETQIADRYLALFDISGDASIEPTLESGLDYRNLYIFGTLEIDPNDEHKFSRPLIESRIGKFNIRDNIARGLQERAVGHAHSAPTYPGESIVSHNGQSYRIVPSIDLSKLRVSRDRLHDNLVT
jgi:hypothetical protein